MDAGCYVRVTKGSADALFNLDQKIYDGCLPPPQIQQNDSKADK
jgi:hypothetical protein